MRLAGEQDLGAASEILIEAATWLIARGAPLWRPDDLVPDQLRPQIEDDTLYLGCLDGEPVATVVLQWLDELFWPEVPAQESAFIHRLAVRRKVAGSGVASALLGWAEGRARAAGCSSLRLDCSADHPGLARYYERAGFERHSDGALGSFAFARYQKRLR